MPLDHPKVLVEAILQQTPVAFLLVNKDGQVIFVNDAALQLAWKNPEHTTIDAQSAPEVWGNTQDFEGRAIPVEKWPIVQALHGIKTVGKELRLIRPDSSHYDISISATPLRTEEGIIGAIASFIDITERRLGEQKLTAINARLEELATERARGIHLMHQIGLSANNVTDTREMLRITLTEICSHLHWPVGYAYIVEAPGRLHCISAWYSSDAERYEALRRATATIDFSLKQSVIGQVLKNGTTVFLPDLDTEEHFLRKEAARKAGLKSYLAIPVIVHKQPAAILEFFHLESIKSQDSVLEVMEVVAAYLSQVIEQKRLEKKLKALFDSAPDAQIVTDMLGTIVMANRQTTKLFGYSQEELLGHAVEILLPADLRSQHIQHRAGYIAAPHARPMGTGMELKGLRKDQTEVPVEVSLSPIELEGGSLIAAAMRDVRERKELEEKLRAKERLAEMGMTAAIFVHELANPLNGISTTAHFIKEMIPADGQDLIANIIIETDRLKLLLDQFRSLSRLSDLKLSSIEFRTLIDHVVKINSYYWLERDIRTVTDYVGDLTVNGDAGKLQQAILNLTGNAVESMPDGGTLTLRAYGTHEEVIFEVTDTGPGIPEGIDVFALFTTTKSQGGSGLGMYIVQQIVLGHLGTITYSSEQGKGTTFRVTLPKKRNPNA